MSVKPIRVRVDYVRSLGRSTEADVTFQSQKVFSAIGHILQMPAVGARLVLFQGNRQILDTTAIQFIDGTARTMECSTKRSVYRVRVLTDEEKG